MECSLRTLLGIVLLTVLCVSDTTKAEATTSTSTGTTISSSTIINTTPSTTASTTEVVASTTTSAAGEKGQGDANDKSAGTTAPNSTTYSTSSTSPTTSPTTTSPTTTSPVEVPSKPSNVTTQSQTTQSIELGVTKGTGGVDCYIIKKSSETIEESDTCTVNMTDSEQPTVYNYTGLDPGQCYNFIIAAKYKNLTSAVYTTPELCTVPSKPSNVTTQSQTTQSIELGVTKGTGGVDCYIIKTSNETIKDSDTCKMNMTGSEQPTVYNYTDLDPGQCYNFIIATKYKNLISAVYTTPELCTVPSKPSNVTTQSQTTQSIELGVTKGTGEVNCYIIKKSSETTEESDTCTVTVTDSEQLTVYNYTGLDPGQCYSFNIAAKYKNHTSAVYTIPELCTVPSKPSNVTAQSQTTQSIELGVTKGTGGVDFYIIKKSSETIEESDTCTVNVTDPGQPTVYNYTGLDPGHCYNFNIAAKYKNLTSAVYTTPGLCTVPSKPSNVTAQSQTTQSIELGVTKVTGGVDFYIIKKSSETIEESDTCTVNVTDPEQPTVYNYTGLDPGHCYNFNIAAKYKNLTSAVYTTPGLCTVPSKPSNVTAQSQTTQSIELGVTKVTGGVDFYIIKKSSETIEESDTCTVNVTDPEQPTVYNYTGLDPGHCYNFNIAAKYKNLTSAVYTTPGLCTVPSKPSNVTAQSQTTQSIELGVTKVTGGVDFYIIKKSSETIEESDTCTVNVTDSEQLTVYNYTGLDPGQCYNFNIAAKYKNLISAVYTTPQLYTVPSKPSNVVAQSQTTQSIELGVTKGTGGVDCYIIKKKSSETIEESGTCTVTVTDPEQLTVYNYTGLDPGQCYNFIIAAKYKNLTSAVYTTPELCTVPSEATNAVVTDRTTTSISFNISKGNGSVDCYIIKANETVESNDDCVVSVTEGGEPTPYRYTNLTAGQCYTFHIVAKYKDNTSSEYTTNSTCTVPSKPSNVTAQSQTTELIELGVTKGTGGVNCYIIKKSSETIEDSDTCTVTVTDPEQLTVYNYTGLDPGQCYNFIIAAKYKNLISDVYTTPELCTVPSIHSNVTAQSQTTQSIELGVTKGTGDVDCYIIKKSSETIRESDTCTVTVTDSEQLTVYNYTGLDPGQCYNFIIAAKYKNLISAVYTTPQLCTVPSKPSNVVAQSQTTQSIELGVTKGTGGVDCYIIKNSSETIEESDICTVTVTDSAQPTVYNYTGLEPGQCYNFIIAAKYKNLISAVYTTHELCTVPSKPANLRVTDRTNSTIDVKWDYGRGSKNINFSVTTNCTSPNEGGLVPQDTYNTSQTSFQRTGLTPGSMCTVIVTPISGDQTGTHAQIHVYNKESAPGAVESLRSDFLTSRSIHITWEKPPTPNGVVRRYDVRVTGKDTVMTVPSILLCCSDCTPQNETLNGCQDKDYPFQDIENTTCPSDAKTFTSTEKSLDINITNLHPYREYSIEVIAYTQCAGNVSSITNKTLEDVQEAPPLNLSMSELSFNGSVWEITLKWNEPDDLNGDITGYTVEYKYLDDSLCYVSRPADGQNTTHESTVSGIPDTHLTLQHGFVSDWDYTFSVTAATSLGPGNYSEELNITTPSSIPGEIDSASVTITDVNNHSAVVKWAIPCQPNGPVTSYNVSWHSSLYPSHGSECNSEHSLQTNDSSTNLTVSLLPSRTYTFTVAAINVNGTGSFTSGQNSTTPVAIPFEPAIPTVVNKSATSVSLNWTRPVCDKYTGPTNYTVTTTNAGDMESGFSTDLAKCTTTGYDNNSCTVNNLEEYWDYVFNVTASTSEGSTSSQQSLKVKTLEAAPGNIRGLTLAPEADVTRNRSITVTWSPPETLDRNGIITSYYIQYNRDNTEEKIVRKDNNTLKVMFENITPGNYDVQVFAATTAGNGSVTKENAVLQAGAPLKPNESQGLLVHSVELAETADLDKQKTIVIQLPTNRFLCNHDNGKPNKWGVVVAEESEATGNPYFGNASNYKNNIIKTRYKTWSQVKDSDPIPAYIPTASDWNPCPTGTGKRRRRDTVSGSSTPYYVVGNEDCDSVSTEDYCNGELKPGRSYKVKVFACTDTGCTETAYSKVLETVYVPLPPKESDPTVPAILGTLAAVVVIAAVAVTLFVMRRKQKACFQKDAEGPTTMTPLEDKSFSSRPVRLADFPQYVDDLFRDSRLKFSEQYQMLKEKSPTFPSTVAESQACRSKNRYTNIMPFDKSRVKLLPLDDEEGSDFINANYIPGYSSRREYIATQGPLPATKDDFWRMIWEQNVEVIVMLTKLMENGRVKCDQYWPELNEPVYFGDLIVSVQSESVLADYIIRIVEIRLAKASPDTCNSETDKTSSQDQETRHVRQLCFLKWPDMGCPDEPVKLLDFVKTVRQNMGPRCKNHPLVVHCSAGVGRTGTFIAVDHLLRHIRDHDEIDIFRLVLDMRQHRCNMVQTEDQYVYIHECLREFINDDEEEEEEEPDDHLYANTNFQGENVYENTAFNSSF